MEVEVIFPSGKKETWRLSTEHAMSSYGMPVLVDERNRAYGPGDLPPGTVLRVRGEAAERARAAGYAVEGS